MIQLMRFQPTLFDQRANNNSTELQAFAGENIAELSAIRGSLLSKILTVFGGRKTNEK